MPFVTLRHNHELKFNCIDSLAGALPEMVARALHVEGSDSEKHLKASDVEVAVSNIGALDVTTALIEILVIANDFPERKENLNERRDVLLNEIREFLSRYDPTPFDSFKGFVWILLAPGAFGEF